MFSVIDLTTFLELDRFDTEFEAIAELQMLLNEEPGANLAVFQNHDMI
jgi:hypothetical protein